MELLLLNQNPVISKLVRLSAEKLGYTFEELPALEEELKFYDFIIIDEDLGIDISLLKGKYNELIILANKSEFDGHISYFKKPFLPTDLLKLIKDIEEKNLGLDLENTEDITANTNDSELENLANFDPIELENSPNADDESKQNDTQDEILNEDLVQVQDLQEHTDMQKQVSDKELDELLANTDDLKDETKTEQEDQELEALSNHDIDEFLTNTDEAQAEDEALLDQKENEEQEEELESLSSVEDFELKEKDEGFDEDLNNEGFELLDELDEDKKETDENSQKQEEEISFDDIPEGAKFLGEKEENLSEDFAPIIEESEEEIQEPIIKDEDAQNQIKKELDELKKLDQEHSEVEISDDENEFDGLNENELRLALGEALVQDENAQMELSSQNSLKGTNENEIISELHKSISGAITSSINDETLRAALKGMNMNIHINISFDEEKH